MNEQQLCPSGRKDDNGKNRLDLIPPEVILALGQVMTYGAGKYGANNWQGVETDRYYAAPVACAHKCGVYGISGGEK